MLHEEKQPIREVQNRIKSDGIKKVIKLGQSIAKASRQKEITDTTLIPERIKFAEQSSTILSADKIEPVTVKNYNDTPRHETISDISDNADMQAALEGLVTLRRRWLDFRSSI